MSTNHLSDVVTVDDILGRKERKFCIVAGVGAGKNTFVTKTLKGHGNIFFVSSRRATINQMLLKEICKEHVDWSQFKDEVFTTTNAGIELLVKNKRFSTSGIKNIIEHFDIFVIDEVHSLATDAPFSSSVFHVYTFLKYIIQNYPEKTILVMTGTYEPIRFFLENDGFCIIDKSDECINVLPKKIEVITTKTAFEIINQLPLGKKTIYYTNSISTSITSKNSLYKKLLGSGAFLASEFAFVFAKGKGKSIEARGDKTLFELEKDSAKAKDYLEKHCKLPPETRVLITTSTLKEGVNIESDDIRIAFCDTHLLSDIQQFAGRVRQGLDTLYIIDDAKQFDVTTAKQKKYFLEILYVSKLIDGINGFLTNTVRNSGSGLYLRNFGNYPPEELHFYEGYCIGDWSIYTISSAAREYIDLVEKQFEFIRFNHLNTKFEPFILAYREHMRIYEYYKSGWKTKVSAFCEKHSICYIDNSKSENIDIAEVKKLLNNGVGVKMIGDNRTQFFRSLSNALKLMSQRANTKTYNKLIHSLNLPYTIYDGKTSRNGGQLRYVTVILDTNE